MKKISPTKITCVCFLLSLSLGTTIPAAPSYANSLINNSATGVVTGSIIQQGNSTIEVGSISFQDGDVQNVTVSAIVNGDIVAGSGTHISVGSYHGK